MSWHGERPLTKAELADLARRLLGELAEHDPEIEERMRGFGVSPKRSAARAAQVSSSAAH